MKSDSLIVVLGLVLSVGFAADLSAQVWRDSQTGTPVDTMPVISGASSILDHPDSEHWVNPRNGKTYVRCCKGGYGWIDVQTGKSVPTMPVISGASSILDHPDPNHWVSPRTGKTYYLDKDTDPCPPPPSSTTGGVKTAAANDLFQFGVGYSFMRTAQEDVKNLNGFQVSGFYNFNSWFALGGEFSGLYGTETETRQFMVGDMKKDFDVKTSLDRYFYLFGPQMTWHPCEHTRVFGHVLVGGVHDRNEVSFPDGSMRSSADAFALAVGVGVDVQVTRHFSVGPSFDYVPTHFTSPTGNNWQNNWRVGVAAKVNF
jgi:opacity protein-like surface antigen